MLNNLKLFQPERKKILGNVDWPLLLFILPVLCAGLVTMNSFTGQSVLFNHQLIWIIISVVAFFVLSLLDLRFLKRTDVLVVLYVLFTVLLLLLFIFGHIAGGAQSWFSLGGFSFQPSDLMKLILILSPLGLIFGHHIYTI